jgi:translation initiation factor 5A
MSKPSDIGSLKVGHHLVIEGEPYRIVSYEKSKPGKHGSAKARIVAINIFNGSKKSIVSPVSARTEIPIIDKRSAQVVSISGDSLQLMDLETYEIFYSSMPDDLDVRKKVAQGVEVEYWSVLGRMKIMRVKGAN